MNYIGELLDALVDTCDKLRVRDEEHEDFYNDVKNEICKMFAEHCKVTPTRKPKITFLAHEG